MKSKSGLVAFVAVLLVVAPVLAKPGSPKQESYSAVGTDALLDSFVNVTTQNTRFTPATFTVPVNATVHVRITQKDPMSHTFTLSAQADYVIPSTLSSAELDAYFQNNNLTDVAIPSTVDSVVWANFTAPAQPGQYEFACRIGGHFQSGMFGFMIVSQEAVPPPPPGLPFGVVTGIMVATLVVVLVFAAIYQVRAVRAVKRPR